MLLKILGLLLVTPLLSCAITYYRYVKNGATWDSVAYLGYFISMIIVLIIVEAFGVGVYLLCS